MLRIVPSKFLLSIMLIISINAFFTSKVKAIDFINTRIHKQYINPRAMGMGGAYIAVADDYNSLFTNPAGLARIEDWQINMAIEAMLATDILDFIDEIQKTSDIKDENKRKTEMVNFLKKMYGNTYYFRSAPLSGVYVKNKWGLGFIPSDLSLDLHVHKIAALYANLISDTSFVYAYGKDFPWFRHARFSIGVSLKAIYRIQMETSLDAIELALNSDIYRKEQAVEGLGLDGDIGMLYTPDLPTKGILSLFRLARPTFGLVIRNVLESGFNNNLHLINKDNDSSEVGKPQKMHRVIDIGTRWEYPSWWVFKPRGIMDFQDIGHPHATFMKTFHIGFELSWKMYNWWKGAYRIGLNQGYLSAGFSARLAWFNLDLVTWGEEVGTEKYKKESRIWMVKMNIEL